MTRDKKKATLNSAYNDHLQGCKYRKKKPLGFKPWLAIVTMKCHYCNKMGIKNRVATRVKSNPSQWDLPLNGIDRVDSKLGYIKGNMVPCCGRCNIMKLKLSKEDFLQAVKEIYEYQKELYDAV